MNRLIQQGLLAGALLLHLPARAQQDEKTYIPPTDTAVQHKLDWWKDQKFGLLMHWGAYSEWGVVESWSICPEDVEWINRKGPYATADYATYKQAYEHLPATFNPVKFDPAKWAAAAKAAGMRYMVFTTKHHDGFCMFDTKQTDYKVTSPSTLFSSNPKANITKEVFNAFRQQDIGIGAYFSKPDWHSPYYWWPFFPPVDRNVNYDPARHPEKWQQFKDYTYNQIKELMSDYGKVDILWLDGGWVRPASATEQTKNPRLNQDVEMGRIAAMGRQLQPGLIVVDRAVGSEYENYRTPEQQIPDHPLSYPWETCMTMGDSWSYIPNDRYKSADLLIHMLVRIVAWGGNFLLNIGPGPDGDWDPVTYQRLQEMGAWMNINGAGIYGSRMVAPYGNDRLFYTQSKDGKTTYVFYLSPDKQEDVQLTNEIALGKFTLPARSRVKLLGQKGNITYRNEGNNSYLVVPKTLLNKTVGKHAVVFSITQ